MSNTVIDQIKKETEALIESYPNRLLQTVTDQYQEILSTKIRYENHYGYIIYFGNLVIISFADYNNYTIKRVIVTNNVSDVDVELPKESFTALYEKFEEELLRDRLKRKKRELAIDTTEDNKQLHNWFYRTYYKVKRFLNESWEGRRRLLK